MELRQIWDYELLKYWHWRWFWRLGLVNAHELKTYPMFMNAVSQMWQQFLTVSKTPRYNVVYKRKTLNRNHKVRFLFSEKPKPPRKPKEGRSLFWIPFISCQQCWRGILRGDIETVSVHPSVFPSVCPSEMKVILQPEFFPDPYQTYTAYL